ncbi:triphosphoribosyl-dephospho-CoA synthase [Halorientalis sp. IM1011]|uniref:triphosphoribosyl-dephospho-CoA synthase n=1 Tax=Halorientalis sp. IM1011 TaxID=1932360 RepID=UPI00097CC6B9|nr:triphosphoribosyl-dephospho-CoA synthase [Halorientalis sp. IM1011]AQL44128.1 triphosphoribosyl-dephospho-CoA synthase [Halorientalis sp. IM1011]
MTSTGSGVEPPPGRTVVDDAQLALLLEVAGTPKPGNVDRAHDYDDLRFEHFLAGGIGARRGLELAADGKRLGRAFERAVAGMSQQRGGNSQFGALLVLTPLVRAAAEGELSGERAGEFAEATTVADAADFFRAFEHVDVAVDDPPEGMDALDVRRGAEAIPAVEERELTLYDVMERSAEVDGIAREWTGEFERSFDAAERLLELDGPVPDRAARVFLELLAEEPDTFVATKHDRETAERASERAAAALAGDTVPAALADEFVAEGINPGTTADLTAAALFVALERGLDV